MIPINRAHNNDAFCRYKMHPLKISHTHGNTTLDNIVEVAADLNRPAEMLLKYLTKTIGTSLTPPCTLPGHRDKHQVASVLDKYIREFVMCQACGNPETAISVRKDRVKLTCQACGSSTRRENACRFKENRRQPVKTEKEDFSPANDDSWNEDWGAED